MRIFVTGATGLVGAALSRALLADGHKIVALSRGGTKARETLGSDIEIVRGDIAHEGVWKYRLEGCDAVVHLAGEPVVMRRWTDELRRRASESRAGAARQIADALRIMGPEKRPRIFVCASAVGIYGARGNEPLTEDAPAGSDYLAKLCVEWEAAANAAQALDVRVCNARLGVVLSRHGGALAKMLPIFRKGLGGPIGSGAQMFPWVHLDDVVRAIVEMVENEAAKGPFNVVAPGSVSNAEFTKELGRALHRPAVLPVPGFALKAIFGEAASPMLSGQRPVPAKLEALGFGFAYPRLAEALGAEVGG